MDQLRALRAFVRVVDEGSFAQAARVLDLAPAGVTRLVADLEQQLGARLLHRTTRKLSLTPTGEQYLERARAILGDLDEADALVRDQGRQPDGVLRISGPLPFMTLQLAPRLPLFHVRWPGIVLEVDSTLPLAVPDERADLTLLLSDPRGLDGDFVARRLARAEVLLCATPDYLRQLGRPTTPSELLRHRVLVPSTALSGSGWTLQRRGSTECFEIPGSLAERAPVTLRSASAAFLLEAARAGLGIATTLSFQVAEELRAGRLERVLPDWQLGHYTLHAAMSSRRFLPARTRVFVDFLLEQFGGEDRDPWL